MGLRARTISGGLWSVLSAVPTDIAGSPELTRGDQNKPAADNSHAPPIRMIDYQEHQSDDG